MRDDDARADNQDTPTSGSDAAGAARISFATLSAYLDDPSDFAPDEQARIEAYLATAEGAARVAEARMLAGGLRELPQVEPPRSFRLAPKQVELPQPVVLRETPQWYARHGAVLRWATAAAALLFVLVLSADLISNGVAPTGSDDEAAPLTSAPSSGGAAEPASTTGASAAEPTATTSAANAAEDAAATMAEASSQLTQEEPTEQGPPPPAATPAAAGTPAPTGDTAEDQAATPVATAGDEGATGGQDDAARNSAEPTPSPAASTEAEQSELGATEDADATAPVEQTAPPEALGFSETSEPGASAASRSGWRTVEFSILAVFVVLLALLVILPRWGSRRA